MGTMRAQPRVEVFVVSSVVGTITFPEGPPRKARAWLLEDHRLIVVTSPDGEHLERNIYDVETVTISKDAGVFRFADGTEATMKLKDCNCGMGVITGARVLDERHKITVVRVPDWVEVNQ